MNHKTTPKFWVSHESLPSEIKSAADRAFALLKENPGHPSLHFKKLAVKPYWSARINDGFRALAVKTGDTCVWFWIGTHAEYDSILKKR